MDLNQLLFRHQVALLNVDNAAPCASRFERARYYARKINDLQTRLGVFITPYWQPKSECCA